MIKKRLLIKPASLGLSFLLCAFTGVAQHSLRLVVAVSPGSKTDSVFVAGNFNGWNPGNKNFLLTQTGRGWEITIPNLAKGPYEFKFTRGSWSKVAVTKSGAALENNLVLLERDTNVLYRLEGWQDHFAPVEKKHSASGSVQIIDTAFNIPQLDRSRRIWVYLPRTYKASKKLYPVLYMHDGQNLFDEYTAANGEWNIDETLDSLFAKGQPESIVVGIDNGPKRLTEYNPDDTERFGKGEGSAYLQFLAKTLKPHIDKNFRTRQEPAATMVAGSSMGGLISYYAMLNYPEVFGKAGIFSPSFWLAPNLAAYTDSASSRVKGKFFFYVGGMEGASAVDDMYKIMNHLGTHSGALMYAVTDPDGRHNEAAWRKWFPEFYKFIMADWTNYPIPLKN